MPMVDVTGFQLRTPPIVEAVLDLDCDLPPGFDLRALEGPSRARFEQYPKFRAQFILEHKIETIADSPPKMSMRLAVQALQLLHDDERQLVQVRGQGFSFNRLAPYSTLDDYLPEIERTWRMYCDLVSPVQVRVIRLRYVNRILVPMTAGTVDLDEFLKIGPRLPDQEGLVAIGFLTQQLALENDTGNEANLVLTAQAPVGDKLPVILDITVARSMSLEPVEWSQIRLTIDSLRNLKNRIFVNTLTQRCIELFQS